MSKRFTETDKWRDPWFRKLTPLQKCLFLYLCDTCNNAGFVEIDVEGWSLSISCKENELQKAWEGLIRGFLISGGWAFIRNYLKHQKHLPLDPSRNPAHRQIAGLFAEQDARFPGLLDRLVDGKLIEAPTEGLLSPIGIGEGEGKGEGEGEGEGCALESESHKQPHTFKQWTRDELTESVNAANADGLLLADEVADFVDYWMEPTPSGKGRITLEKTWETRRRMKTAARMIYEPRRAAGKNGGKQGQLSTLPQVWHDPANPRKNLGW